MPKQVIIKELESGKITIDDLAFFPCVQSGITMAKNKGGEHEYGYGVGLVKYLNKNASGKINCSYKQGEDGAISFTSKHGNHITIEISGGSLNTTGDYLHIINKTRKEEKWIKITKKCEEISKTDYSSALNVCLGRLRWK